MTFQNYGRMLVAMSSARLSDAIRARLDELGLSVSAWQRASGVSAVTLRHMRDGTKDAFTPAKERPAERALGWGPGSFDKIRQGGEPSTIGTSVHAEPAHGVGEAAAPLPPGTATRGKPVDELDERDIADLQRILDKLTRQRGE